MNPATDLWVYLSTSPLAWLALTLAAYVVADRIARRLNRHPLANPVVIAVVLVIIALQVSETPFETYVEGAQFVHFLLGPTADVEQLDIQEGDQIAVLGRQGQIDSESLLIAHLVRVGDETVDVRESTNRSLRSARERDRDERRRPLRDRWNR